MVKNGTFIPNLHLHQLCSYTSKHHIHLSEKSWVYILETSTEFGGRCCCMELCITIPTGEDKGVRAVNRSPNMISKFWTFLL